MRRTLLALSIATLPGLSAAAALPSAIGAVTVYQDRAVVTRQASAELAAGEHELVLEKLPASLQDNSLQVAAKSTGQATLLDVKVRTAYEANTPNDRLRQLEQQINQLDNKKAALDDEAAVLENQRELVTLIQQGATQPGKDGARPSLDELKAVQSLSADTLSRALAGLRRVEEQRADIEREREALANEYSQLQDRQGRRSKTVTLRVMLARPGKLDLNLSYAVAGAQWAPAARLRAADRSVDLGYFGVINQTTGEDWNKVKLTLSTARPSLGGGAPALTPWVVDVAVPPPPMPRRRRAPPAAASEARQMARQKMAVQEQAFDAAAQPEPQPEAVTSATAEVQSAPPAPRSRSRRPSRCRRTTARSAWPSPRSSCRRRCSTNPRRRCARRPS